MIDLDAIYQGRVYPQHTPFVKVNLNTDKMIDRCCVKIKRMI